MELNDHIVAKCSRCGSDFPIKIRFLHDIDLEPGDLVGKDLICPDCIELEDQSYQVPRYD